MFKSSIQLRYRTRRLIVLKRTPTRPRFSLPRYPFLPFPSLFLATPGLQVLESTGILPTNSNSTIRAAVCRGFPTRLMVTAAQYAVRLNLRIPSSCATGATLGFTFGKGYAMYLLWRSDTTCAVCALAFLGGGRYSKMWSPHG